MLQTINQRSSVYLRSLGIVFVLSGVCFATVGKVHAGIIRPDEKAIRDLVEEPAVSEIDRKLQQILDAELSKQKYSEAIDRLIELQQNPDAAADDRIDFMLAVAYQRLGQLAAALKVIDLRLKKRPGWQLGSWMRAAILISQNSLEEAERTLDRAILASPEEPDGYYQRGLFLTIYRATDPSKLKVAISDLKIALKRGASPEMVHGLVGTAYRQLNDPSAAELHLLKAIKLNELNFEAVDELASIYNASSRRLDADRLLASAERSYAKFKPTPDRSAALHRAVAHHAIASNAPSSKIDNEFRTILALSPDDARIRLEFAHWLDRVNRNAEAVPILKDAMSRDGPTPANFAASLAWALAESGASLEEARHWLKVAREENVLDPFLSDTEAWIEFRDGQADRAWEVIQSSLSESNQVPEIAYHAAAILERLGRKELAIKYVREAVNSKFDFGRRLDATRLLSRLQSVSKVN